MQPAIKFALRTYRRDTYTKQDTQQLEAGRSYLDCSLGTNPYGCSPKVLNAPAPSQELFIHYPVPDPSFINKLLNYWREVALLSPAQIQPEAGTFGVIERLHKLFIDDKSVVLGYCPQFSDYGQDVLCSGGSYEYIQLQPAGNYKFSAPELLAALSTRHKLIYLDNPNNPTGQVIPLSEIEAIVKKAEALGSLVLVDEAYGDFMEKKDSAIALIPKYSNLLVARSFTKGFGLAGLRVGYLVMSADLLESYSLVSHPFPVTALSMYYAQIALEDQEFLVACRNNFKETKTRLQQTCRKLQIAHTDPATPILTLSHPNPEFNLYLEFLRLGVITTSGEHFIGLGPNSVRIRIPKEREQFLAIIAGLESEIS